MKRSVLVACKRTVDYAVRVRVKPDGTGVDTAAAKHSLNPFDEIALEQALRMKEQGQFEEVVAVSCAPVGAKTDVLRTALAMGADRALQVSFPPSGSSVEPLQVAKVLRALVQGRPDLANVQLILLGKQAIDDDLGATGQMLSALLQWPQVSIPLLFF
jgi:electron transfer flavoprotein beta subunit